MEQPKWCYSITEEGFVGATDRAEAIRNGADQAREDGSTEFYVAPAVIPVLKEIVLFDSSSILEDLVLGLDEIPEDCQWLQDLSSDKYAELDELLQTTVVGWLEKHGLEPTWFNVGTFETLRTADYPEETDAD